MLEGPTEGSLHMQQLTGRRIDVVDVELVARRRHDPPHGRAGVTRGNHSAQHGAPHISPIPESRAVCTAVGRSTGRSPGSTWIVGERDRLEFVGLRPRVFPPPRSRPATRTIRRRPKRCS